jgi:hypothetical protein
MKVKKMFERTFVPMYQPSDERLLSSPALSDKFFVAHYEGTAQDEKYSLDIYYNAQEQLVLWAGTHEGEEYSDCVINEVVYDTYNVEPLALPVLDAICLAISRELSQTIAEKERGYEEKNSTLED